MTGSLSHSGQLNGQERSGGFGLRQGPRANTAVELLVSLLHSSSHPHRRQQQRQQQQGNTKSFDTDDADTGDVEQMSVLQRKVLYALSSALRGNVDVQVCMYPLTSSYLYCVSCPHERTINH